MRQLKRKPRRARLEGDIIKKSQNSNHRSGPVEPTHDSVPATCTDTTDTGKQMLQLDLCHCHLWKTDVAVTRLTANPRLLRSAVEVI